MKGELARSWSALVLVCVVLFGPVVPASAQTSNDTGIIQITVKDAGAEKALSDARVFLIGPTVASALTTKSGIVKYTDVPSGLYRVRVSKSGFAGVTSAQFEVLGNKEVDVDVDLGVGPTRQTASNGTNTSTSTNGYKIIGTVRARVIVTTTDVDANSAVRKISDSLTDALSTIGGVDVTQSSNDPNAPQTISLRGHDESQTAITLDGIPLGAPGTAANLRAINTDLFTGAGVSFGATAGALGGSVNFRTLQPTLTWQTMLSSSYGTFDRYNYQIGETGSIGKLGIAVLTTKRAGNNPLTFQDYLDESGLQYVHGGESANIGDYLKLRYAMDDRTTLMFTALQNNQSTSALCTQFVTPLPCGIGPDNGSTGRFHFMYGTVQSLIGDTAVTVTGYVNNNQSFNNDLNRYILQCPGQLPGTIVSCPFSSETPVLSPLASTSGSLARGVAASATTTRDKQTFTLSGSTYAGITTSTPIVGGEGFVTPSTFGIASRQVQLTDSYKVNDKLAVGPNVSYAGTSGVGTSILFGFSADWRPVSTDTYDASVSYGSSQPAPGLIRSYSDPQSARINCYADTAIVSGPGDLPSHQSAASYDLSWIHQWGHGQFSLDTYRQTQGGQLVTAAVTGNSLGISDPSNPFYQAVTGYFNNVCGAPAGGGTYPNMYVQEPIGGTTRVYQGYTATANIGIGKNLVLIPSFTTSSADVISADPRYLGLDSTLILGAQLPGRPLHTGNLTLDGLVVPLGLEVLANAHYVGIGNNQNISPYVTVNAGLSHAAGIGRLTVFASNLFNTESGEFSTLLYAVPTPLSGGGELIQAARPNGPRTYTVTYSFNTGARPGAGFARPRNLGTAAATSSASPPPRGALGFGRLSLIPPPAGTDPLSLATARPECTADLQPMATKVLAQIGAAASAYAAGHPLPEIDGLTVTPHGDPVGTWWLGLGPKIPEGAFRNRQGGQGNGNGGNARPRGAPGGAPGGEGGPPEGGFQPVVSVGPAPAGASPRPEFSPSPELIAALAPLRALASCAYGTVLTTTEAKAKGYDIAVGVQLAQPSPAPGASPAPEPSANPRPLASASPAPGRRGQGSPLNYAPGIGIFVVRPPDLGTGGGSVKQ
jgi:hypothetical protein